MGERSAEVEDWVLFPVEGLGQDGTQPHLRCICMDDERKVEVGVPENGRAGEGLLESLKYSLCNLGPSHPVRLALVGDVSEGGS